MPAYTPRLGLAKIVAADLVDLDLTFGYNPDILDKMPGVYVCTSTTRPVWAVNQSGSSIWETDTKLMWTWNGAAFERIFPKGKLSKQVRTADYVTSTTGLETVLKADVVVPDGGRDIEVVVSFTRIDSNTDPYVSRMSCLPIYFWRIPVRRLASHW